MPSRYFAVLNLLVMLRVLLKPEKRTLVSVVTVTRPLDAIDKIWSATMGERLVSCMCLGRNVTPGQCGAHFQQHALTRSVAPTNIQLTQLHCESMHGCLTRRDSAYRQSGAGGGSPGSPAAHPRRAIGRSARAIRAFSSRSLLPAGCRPAVALPEPKQSSLSSIHASLCQHLHASPCQPHYSHPQPSHGCWLFAGRLPPSQAPQFLFLSQHSVLREGPTCIVFITCRWPRSTTEIGRLLCVRLVCFSSEAIETHVMTEQATPMTTMTFSLRTASTLIFYTTADDSTTR